MAYEHLEDTVMFSHSKSLQNFQCPLDLIFIELTHLIAGDWYQSAEDIFKEGQNAFCMFVIFSLSVTMFTR